MMTPHRGLYLERAGRRIYVRGDSYPVRETLKSGGAQWDPAQRAWWVSSSGVDRLQDTIDQAGLGRVRGWQTDAPASGPGMRATIGLRESVHGDLRTLGRMEPYARRTAQRLMTTKPWVARITGVDPRFELLRTFVRGKRDWSEADKKGRGIVVWFVLEPGVYEAFEPGIRYRKQHPDRRWFLRVDPDGSHAEITREEAEQAMDYQFTELHGPHVVKTFYTRCAREGLTLTSRWRSPSLWRGIVSGGEVVAFYALLKMAPKRWRIKALYVVRDLRRQGIGKRCVLDAMDQARATGATLEALAHYPGVNPGWTVTGPERALKSGLTLTPMRWSPEDAQA